MSGTRIADEKIVRRHNELSLGEKSAPEDSSILRLTAATGGAVHVAVGIAGVGGGKLHVDRGKLRGLARAAERSLAAEFLELLHRSAAAHLQRSPDRPRRHAVDANALRSQLLRQ